MKKLLLCKRDGTSVIRHGQQRYYAIHEHPHANDGPFNFDPGIVVNYYTAASDWVGWDHVPTAEIYYNIDVHFEFNSKIDKLLGDE